MDKVILKKKICLLGDGSVGKTSLIRKFVYDKFDDSYITTVGVKVTKKVLEMDDQWGGTELTLLIWDVLGQKGYQRVQSSSYAGAEGALMVCDITRKETLQSLKDYWIPNFREVAGDAPLVMLVNKVDLEDQAQIERYDADDEAREMGLKLLFTSAKTGQGVEEAFKAMGESLAQAREDSAPKRVDLPTVEDTGTLVDVTDKIIADFVENFSTTEDAMPVVRRQFDRAGVDVKIPSKEALKKAIEYLAEVEKGFKSGVEVRTNMHRRMRMIASVK